MTKLERLYTMLDLIESPGRSYYTLVGPVVRRVDAHGTPDGFQIAVSHRVEGRCQAQADRRTREIAAMIHLCLEELLPLVKEAIAEHKEQIDWRQRYREEVYGW
jgi:hypothetical protein